IIATKFGILHMPEEGGSMDLDSSHDSILKQVDKSLTRLGTDYIDLYYQHRIDPNVSPEEVAETMKELHEAGKIRAWGVSFAPVDYIERAHKIFPLSAVENMYNMLDRQDDPVYFDLCEKLGLAYVSACPLAKGFLSGTINKETTYREGNWRNRMPLFSDEVIDQNQVLLALINEFAEKKNATAAQISLAWEMHQRPFMIPIPGTTKMHRVKENYGSVYVDLTDDEMKTINDQLAKMPTSGMRQSAGRK
ncbi:MAG: aldo/keto reductase, partial [Solobacterium sp.]|nr:aldo/keto reductase [Solobacterium sp.]